LDAGTQAALIIAATTVALPLSVSAGLTWLIAARGPRAASALVGLTLGLLASFCGVMSWGQLWGPDAARALFWSALAAGLLMSGAERLSARWRGPLTLVTLILASYMTLSPLAGLWAEGLAHALTQEWLISPIIIAWGALLLNRFEVEAESSPAQLASLAVSFGVAAPVVGLSGSASIAQLLAAFGLSVAGVGLVALRRGEAPSWAVFVCGYVALYSTLLYAHHYLVPPLPASVATLLLIAPCGVRLTSRWSDAPLKQVAASIALALLVSLSALGLVVEQQLGAQEAVEVDEFGASY